MNWATIKEIAGALVAIVIVVFGVGAALLEWRIGVAVTAQLAATGQVSQSSVDANTESIKDLEGADLRMDNKIERIVDILLED